MKPLISIVQVIRPHLRALLITLHLLALIIVAFPAPQGGMNRRAWSNPTVQAEFAAWADRITALGWSITAQEFEESLWEFAVEYMRYRKAMIKPIKPYHRYCGTQQSWRLFIAPHRNPARLHIDLRLKNQWKTLYISRDSEYRWRAEAFDNERFRAALFRYAWPHYSKYYRQFGHWVARALFKEYPDAQEVRLRWYRYHTLSPERILNGEVEKGRFEKTLTFRPQDLPVL